MSYGLTDDLIELKRLLADREAQLAEKDACAGAPHASRAACQLEREQLQSRLTQAEATIESLRRQLETLIDGDTLHALLAQTQCQLTTAEATLARVTALLDENAAHFSEDAHIITPRELRRALLGEEPHTHV